jgi:diguanylate cyclase (GGDEF)-like protein
VAAPALAPIAAETPAAMSEGATPPPDERRGGAPAVGLLLAMAVAGLLLVQLVVANRRAGTLIGVTLGPDATGMTLEEVAADGPAARAGLRAGDVVTAVGEVRVDTAADYRRAATSFRRGAPVAFTVRRDGTAQRVTVEPGVALAWEELLLNALSVLAYLAIALLAWRQREGDLRARLLFLFSVAVMVEFLLPDLAGPLYELALRPAFYLVTGLQIGVEVHLASVIPERQAWLRRWRWVVPLYYAIGVGLGLVGVLSQLAEAGLPLALPWSLDGYERVLYGVGFPLWALTVTALLARPALGHPEPQKRHQAALVLVGVLPWVIVVALRLGYSLAALEPPAWIGGVEPLALLCGPVAVLVAISRYQLFDLELVVRRGLVYGALTTALLLLFYAALGAGGVLFSELTTGGDRVWVVAAATLLLGLAFTPLRRSLERFIYRRFFPERLALRQRLADLAAELPALGKLPLMGKRLVEQLAEILGVPAVTLLIADPASGVLMRLASTLADGPDGRERSLLLSPGDPGLRRLGQSGRASPARRLAARSAALAQRLAALEAEVAVPLLSRGRLVGLLLLGPKRGRDRYLAEEMELLDLLAGHVAVVLQNVRLFESATRDGLTGLLRREAVLERLDAELQRALRYGRPLAIGIADLDHFKSVNDRHGHLTGDSVLEWVARLLERGLRATDHVGRYGGEEFLLVLPESDLAGAVVVAEKVRALIDRQRFVGEHGTEVGVTVSIGLAALSEVAIERLGNREAAIRELIGAADRALYAAKAAGRNRVHPAPGAGGDGAAS